MSAYPPRMSKFMPRGTSAFGFAGIVLFDLNSKPAAFPMCSGSKEAMGHGVCNWVAYPGDVIIALCPKRPDSSRLRTGLLFPLISSCCARVFCCSCCCCCCDIDCWGLAARSSSGKVGPMYEGRTGCWAAASSPSTAQIPIFTSTISTTCHHRILFGLIVLREVQNIDELVIHGVCIASPGTPYPMESADGALAI